MSTRGQVAYRVDVVYRLLLSGLDRARIIEYLGSEAYAKKHKPWHASPRTIDRYIAKANQLIIEGGACDRELERGRAIAALFDLYALARQKGSVRDCLAVRAELNKLFALYEPVRIEVTEILAAIDSEIARKRREVEQLERQYDLESAPDAGA